MGDTSVNVLTVLAPLVMFVLVLARAGHKKSPGEGSQRLAGASLVIRGVEVYFAPPHVSIQVIAKVNSREYVYPQVTEAQWRKVGCTYLTPQGLTLPPTRRGYEVSFKMVVCDALNGTQFAMMSQWVEKRQKPPFSGEYYVHAMPEDPKSTHILAVVSYDIQESEVPHPR